MEETAEVHPAEMAGEAEAMAVQEAVREEAKADRKEEVAALGLSAQADLSQLRRLRARIVVAVALHEIDNAPDTKPGSKCYNKGLQNVYCAIEKCHK